MPLFIETEVNPHAPTTVGSYGNNIMCRTVLCLITNADSQRSKSPINDGQNLSLADEEAVSMHEAGHALLPWIGEGECEDTRMTREDVTDLQSTHLLITIRRQLPVECRFSGYVVSLKAGLVWDRHLPQWSFFAQSKDFSIILSPNDYYPYTMTLPLSNGMRSKMGSVQLFLL